MREDSTQRWYAVWSLVLWAVGTTSLVVVSSLPESAFESVPLGVFVLVLVLVPAGLALGVLALRTNREAHRILAATGVVLNSISLALYILSLVIGAVIATQQS